ncbi:peptide/nickel transport system ATP-binding protein [Ferrithrix thermotolerans DSM 19514]|uniref:Peptide/nickel transport system ATP-binding protein n=1 Tax=Ferrithrix thermotolerans DSM 19514 TaxID=1121881 RepID=A0A1M4XT17_9ACTN|nr:ABC transporter ATP-binding protein [Ferrithrix thermotolerans]SHE96423.1 peptide/nickel transport system ATP-binding protein [Ferrithrix thermotolerans DSM 19514]
MSKSLVISDLTIRIGGQEVVSQITLELESGRRLGIIGESGSGKSLTVRSILGDIPRYATTEGKVVVQDRSVLELQNSDLLSLRRNTLSLVPQTPSATLDPSMKIGRQIALASDAALTKVVASDGVAKILRLVGFEGNELEIMNRYPHQLSGGQQQRVAVALALWSNPRVLIADEPTSSLDSILARDIVEAIKRYSDSSGASVVLVTHNLHEVIRLCSEVAILYRGHLVEHGITETVFREPMHPYSATLLQAYGYLNGKYISRIGGATVTPNDSLPTPTPKALCPYLNDCPIAKKLCSTTPPPRVTKPGQAACHFALEVRRLSKN